MLKTTFLIFSNLRKLSEVFGNLRKCSENWENFQTIRSSDNFLKIFEKSLVIFGSVRKCSENFGNLWKIFKCIGGYEIFEIITLPISDTCGIMSLFCSYWLYIACFNSNKLPCFIVTVNNAVRVVTVVYLETTISWKTKTAKMKLTYGYFMSYVVSFFLFLY